ncbi:MAG: hypothetical protein HC936_14275 [Leptolyngbyaceae cyanobacterium SU_3_3]|nr:hypothetical protein [Leptolyngbyaceae cyanobacterium SU_3_3]
MVAGDSDRLQQIVWNLLSNAIKFTPNGGTITLHLERTCVTQEPIAPSPSHNGSKPTLSPPCFAQFTLHDTGAGIPPQFLPWLFDPFRQADSSVTRHFGGLGLGLAIVRRLVELHGGTIRAESEGEDQGATFIVQIPLLKPVLGSSQSSLDSLLTTQIIRRFLTPT